MSGKKVVLLGDLGTDHEGFPPTPVISGSPNVFIDGKPVARVGDQLAPHSKPKHPPHPRTIVSGSSTVFINGVPVAITGGEISCGGVTIGSGTVVVGDTHTPVPFSGISPAPARPQPAVADDGVRKTAASSNAQADASSAPPLARSPEIKQPRLPNTVRPPAQARGASANNGVGGGTATSSERPEEIQESGKTLRLGVFFDGTGNHMQNDRQLTDRDVTNVVKLFDTYVDDGFGSNRRRVYISGPGTVDGKQTPDGFKAPEDTLGLALGVGTEGGHDRIEKAILEVTAILEDGQFSEVTIDVFGFSRGAALARHFVNLINGWPNTVLLPEVNGMFSWEPMITFKRVTAFPPRVKARVGFVGLFDTVGSFYLPGDDSNLDFNLSLAPGSAERVVHLTAYHEIRKNFPLTSIAGPHGQLPAHFTELSVPGVHSDVGGGYENPDKDIRNYETFTVRTYPGNGSNWRTVQATQRKVEALNASDPRNIQMRVQGMDVIAEERRSTRKELAIFSFKKMYRYALESGVPLRAIDGGNDDYRVPEDLQAALNQWQAAGSRPQEARKYLDGYIHTSHREGSLAHAPEPMGQRRTFPNRPERAALPQKEIAHAQ